jgi:hypothetical protein
VLASVFAVVAIALACGGRDSTAPSLASGVVDTAHIKLNYMCGNTFRARNYNDVSVTVTWDVQGTAEQGTLLLPPRPAGEGFSATLFTPQHVGTVRLLYQGQVLQSKGNEGGPPCPAETVGLQPPDSSPAWFRDDTSYADGGNGFLKGVIGILFREGTGQLERQSAIDTIAGVVIGGERFSAGDGFYYVRLSDDSAGTQLMAAVRLLKQLPQVELASLVYQFEE